jgi:hypothetical protein
MANQTEREFTATLISILNYDHAREELASMLDVEDDDESIASIQGMEAASFKDEGVMSSNEGLTVRLPNGRAFQLTVVRSR